MAWAIEFDTAAQRELNKLDPAISRRILKFLLGRVAKLDDRAASASASRDSFIISGSIAWAITASSCSFKQEVLVVLVLESGHRREIYKR